MKQKKFLFIFKEAPHSSLQTKEGLDFAFSCAAFEQKVDLLFCDDGIFQLLKNQNTEMLGIKNHSLSIEAAKLYGIENCYFEEKNLHANNLDKDKLFEDAEITPENFWQTLKDYDFILNY